MIGGELTEEDTKKIMRTEGKCVNCKIKVAEHLCNNCKDVYCVQCKKLHLKDRADHKMIYFMEEAVNLKDTIVAEAENAKSGNKEDITDIDKTIEKIAKKIKIIMKEFEAEILRSINNARTENMKTKKMNERYKILQRAKADMEKLLSKDKYLESYLYGLKVLNKRAHYEEAKVENSTIFYEKLAKDLENVGVKFIEEYNKIHEFIRNSKEGIKQYEPPFSKYKESEIFKCINRSEADTIKSLQK